MIIILQKFKIIKYECYLTGFIDMSFKYVFVMLLNLDNCHISREIKDV